MWAPGNGLTRDSGNSPGPLLLRPIVARDRVIPGRNTPRAPPPQQVPEAHPGHSPGTSGDTGKMRRRGIRRSRASRHSLDVIRCICKCLRCHTTGGIRQGGVSPKSARNSKRMLPPLSRSVNPSLILISGRGFFWFPAQRGTKMTLEHSMVEGFRWAMQLSNEQFLLLLTTMATAGFAVGAAAGKIRNTILGL